MESFCFDRLLFRASTTSPGTGVPVSQSGFPPLLTFPRLVWSYDAFFPELMHSFCLLCRAQQGNNDADVVVVGAGMAGLTCAVKLRESRPDLNVKVIESADDVGGRVRSDVVDGFILDRGFAIFLTSYPEVRSRRSFPPSVSLHLYIYIFVYLYIYIIAGQWSVLFFDTFAQAKAILDYGALDLKPFYAGALVRHEGGFHRVADPFRHPQDVLGTLGNPIGSIVDKVKVGILRFQAMLMSVDQILAMPETTTATAVDAQGFSSAMKNLFFRPFLGGIFFNRDLSTTSRMFYFVMKMLATGSNCLPANGIGAVSAQLAARLPSGSIALNTKVERIVIPQADSTDSADAAASSSSSSLRVILHGGRELTARRVVVATAGPEAARLLGDDAVPQQGGGPGVGTANLYFRAPRAPRVRVVGEEKETLPVQTSGGEPILYLNGGDHVVVNNCCFPSTVAPSYAPMGETLVSCSTVGIPDLSENELVAAVKEELTDWFGRHEVDAWTHIKTYRIPFSQPVQIPPTILEKPVVVNQSAGLYVCGDHRDHATLDGAIKSGRRAAEAILKTI